MMAGDDEPERIFQQATIFYKAQAVLRKKKPDDRDEEEALTITICFLQAFIGELLLKCLIRIEGGTPPQIHDLLCLFNLLSAPTRERLEVMWRDYVQTHPDPAALKRAGVLVEPELTSALAAGRKGFERIRYFHEEHHEDFVFYLGALLPMLMRVAVVLRPNWGPVG
jgi:HEPN domain-containing protein